VKINLLSIVEPSLAAAELFCEGESTSLSCGDIFWASVNRLQHATNSFWCAPHLSTVKKVLTEAHEFFEKRDPAKLRFTLAYQQTLNKLVPGCRNDVRNEQSLLIGQSAKKNVRVGIGMNL
jgi:ERCC4-related helicase